VEGREIKQQTDDGESNQGLSFNALLAIVLSGHLGVRKREQRGNDFDRANGLHVFLVAVLYLGFIVMGLIALVSYIAC